MPRDSFRGLKPKGLGAGEDMIIELVYEVPRTPQEVAESLRILLPEADISVASAFGEGVDRFHFATFHGICSDGQELEVFEFARHLASSLDLDDANPVLSDSLYGAAAIGDPWAESAGKLCTTSTDPSLPHGWALAHINAPAAWEHSKGEGVRIAVIDTGHSDHVELQDAVDDGAGLNLVEGGNDARDRFSVTGLINNPGHGTLVCSVVASRGGMDSGGATTGPGKVTGAAPAATLVPIRAITSVVNFRQTTIPAAINHAIAHNCDVVVMALGGPVRVAATEAALRRAVDNGLVVVCAAGNCWPRVVFPAAYAREQICTAVAALTNTDFPWSKTARGPAVVISAPGENVWGARKRSVDDSNDEINAAQGTTLATSLTAGVAALWIASNGGRSVLRTWAQNSGTTVQAMFNAALRHGAQKPPTWDGHSGLGAGVLDAERILSATLPPQTEATLAPAPSVLSQLLTTEILAHHLADYGRDGSVPTDLEPYAAEMLWISYRNAARRRIAQESTLEGGPQPKPERFSPGLEHALQLIGEEADPLRRTLTGW